jgi:hypothetical protein
MKIMVFLHGTVLMHSSAMGRTREERVQQVIDGDESLYDFDAYLPVGEAVQKLQTWTSQGAEVVYLSSHRIIADVAKDLTVLRKHAFPEGLVYFRQGTEGYGDVAARVLPDILIEDDCESIGGVAEMTYPQIDPDLKVRIKSIVVNEFGGIDHLPDDLDALINRL